MTRKTAGNHKKNICPLLLIICISLAPAIAAAAHGTCSDCHIKENELKQAEINQLCLSCHSGGTRNDHKTGIPPSTMKSGLPLDKEGKISCITCHDQHGKTAGSKLLRMDKNALCLDCHDK